MHALAQPWKVIKVFIAKSKSPLSLSPSHELPSLVTTALITFLNVFSEIFCALKNIYIYINSSLQLLALQYILFCCLHFSCNSMSIFTTWNEAYVIWRPESSWHICLGAVLKQSQLNRNTSWSVWHTYHLPHPCPQRKGMPTCRIIQCWTVEPCYTPNCSPEPAKSTSEKENICSYCQLWISILAK